MGKLQCKVPYILIKSVRTVVRTTCFLQRDSLRPIRPYTHVLLHAIADRKPTNIRCWSTKQKRSENALRFDHKRYFLLPVFTMHIDTFSLLHSTIWYICIYVCMYFWLSLFFDFFFIKFYRYIARWKFTVLLFEHHGFCEMFTREVYTYFNVRRSWGDF